MKAKVNGVEVEGTPEEIAKLLGIAIKDPDAIVSTSDSFDSISAYYCPPEYNPGFCCPNINCDSCWAQWRIHQRELELNKGKLVKGEEKSGF